MWGGGRGGWGGGEGQPATDPEGGEIEGQLQNLRQQLEVCVGAWGGAHLD